jgi:hypothetical protein
MSAGMLTRMIFGVIRGVLVSFSFHSLAISFLAIGRTTNGPDARAAVVRVGHPVVAVGE